MILSAPHSFMIDGILTHHSYMLAQQPLTPHTTNKFINKLKQLFLISPRTVSPITQPCMWISSLLTLHHEQCKQEIIENGPESHLTISYMHCRVDTNNVYPHNLQTHEQKIQCHTTQSNTKPQFWLFAEALCLKLALNLCGPCLHLPPDFIKGGSEAENHRTREREKSLSWFIIGNKQTHWYTMTWHTAGSTATRHCLQYSFWSDGCHSHANHSCRCQHVQMPTKSFYKDAYSTCNSLKL